MSLDPDALLDSDALLAGPRGRRLCLEVARGTPGDTGRSAASDELWRAVAEASYLLDPGAGTSVVRMVFDREGTRRNPEPPPVVAPADVAALLDAGAYRVPDDAALYEGLGMVVAFAWYWQAPGGEDLLAAAPEVRAALAPVARAVAEAPGAAWWTQGVEREDQWVVRFDRPGYDAPPPRTSDVVLEAWWRGTSAVEAQFAANARPGDSPPIVEGTPGPGWASFPGIELSGPWWSMPPAGLLGSTRRWPGEHGGEGPVGPVGLSLVEESAFDFPNATAARLVIGEDVRVLELDGPEAWADLCRRHPMEVTASRRHDWRRATGRVGRWVIPDWTSVAREVDAVHLTTSGYLATVGRVIDVGGGGGTASVLAGWDPDRTVWFRGARRPGQRAALAPRRGRRLGPLRALIGGGGRFAPPPTREVSGVCQSGAVTDFERPVADRYFEDYVPGISVRCGAEEVTEADVLRFAREFDPQWIHTDPDAAADGPFGGLIASGWHTGALMMRLFATWFLNDRASLASPGVDELRWTLPVRPGDVLSAQFTVLDARASRSKPDRGIVRTRIEVCNQDDEPVMSLIATNMVRRRDANA